MNQKELKMKCLICGHEENERYYLNQAHRFQMKPYQYEEFETCQSGDHVQCVGCMKILCIDIDFKDV